MVHKLNARRLPVDLFFAPLSCSLATRVALYEAGLPANFFEVVLSTKRLRDGRNYLEINPKGQVPALRTDDGELLTEGPAILQYVADLAPDSGLAPAAGTLDRYRLQMWLNFIASEVHKQVFYPVFNPAAPPEAKAFARDHVLPIKYRFLCDHLAGRSFLLEGFTVADAYLWVTLNWAAPAGVDLTAWPELASYHARMGARPAVARALIDELAIRAAA
jgi:glutathione S-transferase